MMVYACTRAMYKFLYKFTITWVARRSQVNDQEKRYRIEFMSKFCKSSIVEMVFQGESKHVLLDTTGQLTTGVVVASSSI